MTTRHKIFLCALLLVAPTAAQESGVIDNPTPKDVTVREYRIVSILSVRLPDWRFVLEYQDNNGTKYVDDHQGVYDALLNPRGADRIIKTINTRNFSTNSMQKQMLQHLEDEGLIPPMTVQGTPEVPPSGDALKPAKPLVKPPTGKPPTTIKKGGGA